MNSEYGISTLLFAIHLYVHAWKSSSTYFEHQSHWAKLKRHTSVIHVMNKQMNEGLRKISSEFPGFQQQKPKAGTENHETSTTIDFATTTLRKGWTKQSMDQTRKKSCQPLGRPPRSCQGRNFETRVSKPQLIRPGIERKAVIAWWQIWVNNPWKF
ncbi:hypothetical protein Y032_0293g1607 [Ancylostoma ceylanicum]|uniref:Uncharacterized protein n=1 Tax=Ancylostoma ceylanicum TaxID=53326 RepID=A0A016S5Q4_9BILA|nr:hypothetical protein Y032_0293g1607 [Ancylostoma ceylanicum]